MNLNNVIAACFARMVLLPCLHRSVLFQGSRSRSKARSFLQGTEASWPSRSLGDSRSKVERMKQKDGKWKKEI